MEKKGKKSFSFFYKWVQTKSCTTIKRFPSLFGDNSCIDHFSHDLNATQPCCIHAVTLGFPSNTNRIQQTTQFKAILLCKWDDSGPLLRPWTLLLGFILKWLCSGTLGASMSKKAKPTFCQRLNMPTETPSPAFKHLSCCCRKPISTTQLFWLNLPQNTEPYGW